jgi:hypothetical protein
MKSAMLIAALVLSSTTIAIASPRVGAAEDAEADEVTTKSKKKSDDDQMVLLDASNKLGGHAQVDKVRRVLDQKGLLMRLPDRLEAALDGRTFKVDSDSIRDAYAKLEFATALEMVDENETRILTNAGGGDPIPALAELAEWRGLIAAGMERNDEAIRWFRAAVRLNPAWSPDTKLASTRIRPLVRKARKTVEETGKLKIESDPETAMVQIDDGKPQPIKSKLTLEAGHHLVMITAPGRGTYAEMVEIVPEKLYKLEISLTKESESDKAAKLIDATVTAPPGKSRLKKTRALAEISNGAKRFLVIEESTDEKLTLRYYDVDANKVSKPIELMNQTSSNGIARKLIAALDPDNMVEPSSVVFVEKQRSQRWYERWYVWAGVAVLAGGGYLGYHYMTREPTAVRGF